MPIQSKAEPAKTHIEGLTTIASDFGPRETMDRLETEIRTKGMEVFARIDHAAGATEVGLSLRPTELTSSETPVAALLLCSQSRQSESICR